MNPKIERVLDIAEDWGLSPLSIYAKTFKLNFSIRNNGTVFSKWIITTVKTDSADHKEMFVPYGEISISNNYVTIIIDMFEDSYNDY